MGFGNDAPLCVCGHGPHSDRTCGHSIGDKICQCPQFVRTDVAIARSLGVMVKIFDTVGAQYMAVWAGNRPEEEILDPSGSAPEDPAPAPVSEDPPLTNLSPLFPSRVSAALQEEPTDGGTDETSD